MKLPKIKTKGMKDRQVGNVFLRQLLVLLGLGGLIIVLLLDHFYWQTGINYEKAPDYSPSHLARSLLIFLSVVLLFVGLRGSQTPRLDIAGVYGTLLISSSTVGIMILALLYPILLIVNPELFNTLSMEDGPVEWVSALLYFGCMMLFALSFIRCHRGFMAQNRGCWLFVLPAAVLFMLGMEEISWLQRVLGIETFGIFVENDQEEINLHNFYTQELETAFYFAAFLFLVVLPFVRVCHPSMVVNRYMAILVPLPFVIVAGAMASAYNFDMWNIMLMQAAFFGSIIILWLMAGLSRSASDKTVLLAAIVVMVTVQALFLLGGDRLMRSWEVTEYRELFIPLAIFFYSLGVYSQVIGINLVSLPAGMQQRPH